MASHVLAATESDDSSLRCAVAVSPITDWRYLGTSLHIAGTLSVFFVLLLHCNLKLPNDTRNSVNPAAITLAHVGQFYFFIFSLKLNSKMNCGGNKNQTVELPQTCCRTILRSLASSVQHKVINKK